MFFAGCGGTARGAADRIAERIGAEVIDLRSADAGALQDYNVIVFAVATYGRGAPPRGYEAAWEALRAREARLDGVKFAVCGVGSSAFARTFVKFARDVAEKMRELGAVEMAPVGEIDEMEDVEFDFEKWMDEVKENAN